MLGFRPEPPTGYGRLITAQLVDASTGAHLWADRFDGALEDVFDLQDRITESVVGALQPTLRQAEIERTRRKTPASLDAYDYYLRGEQAARSGFLPRLRQALEFFAKAETLDPNFAEAFAADAPPARLAFYAPGTGAAAPDTHRTLPRLAALRERSREYRLKVSVE